MYPRLALLLASLVAFTGLPLHGQRRAPAPTSLSADWTPPAIARGPAPAPTPQPFSARFSQSDHRWEGAIFGFALVGVTGALVQAGSCREPDGQAGDDCAGRALVGGLIGAAAGGAVGFLVGKGIPK